MSRKAIVPLFMMIVLSAGYAGASGKKGKPADVSVLPERYGKTAVVGIGLKTWPGLQLDTKLYFFGKRPDYAGIHSENRFPLVFLTCFSPAMWRMIDGAVKNPST